MTEIAEPASDVASEATAKRPVELAASPGFLEWLGRERLSVAFTTYQTNRLFLLGRREGRFTGCERLLDRPMGLHATADRLHVATRYQLWRFENVLAPGERLSGKDAGADRLYVPRAAHVTGEVDAHDLAPLADGRIAFVNTLYSCLAVVSERHSFEELWRPPFVSRLAPEDRCHLNGVAMESGVPRFVTAVSRSDVRSGWRDRRRDGGVVLDVASGEIAAQGLSMPHSPWLHRGELWVLDSGRGDLGRVDLATGRFEPLVFCPGYLRGLAFHGDWAILGLSKPRDRAFRDLPLQEELERRDAVPHCGIQVIELATGNVAHWVEIGDPVVELYDVALLPGVEHPVALGFRTDELRRTISFEEGAPGSSGVHRRVTRHRLTELQAAGQPSDVPLPAPVGNRQTPTLPMPGETAPQQRSRGPATPSQAAGQGSPKQGSPRQAIVVREVSLETALQNARFTFPDLRRTAQSRRVHEPLLGAAALIEGTAVGAAVAEQLSAGTAEVLSLFVHPEYRRRGLAGGLLQALETTLAKRGVRELGGSFRTHWSERAAIEALLRARGYSEPVARRLLIQVDERMANADWLAREELPAGWTVFPWSELSAEDRQDILDRQRESEWFPPALTPFQLEDRIHAPTSLGLRHDGRVVGWLITHLVMPETLQYTCLFVERGAQRGVRSVPLLVAGVRRQLDLGIPRGIFMIDVENRPMMRFYERRLKPFAVQTSELKWASKTLSPDPTARVH
jgi:uncharacterized protein (TIGR03032 family)